MESKDCLAQLKVLYVEDDAETRHGLGAFLKRRVGKLYLAEDGKEGLELFYEYRPDIVIADLLMPGIHGLEMLEKMRMYMPDCRFIITSSVNETDTVLEAVEVGIIKYVVKPISLPELDKTLKKAAENLYKNQAGVFALEVDEKKKYEAQIKKDMALFLKKIAGKGPRDVAVFIHDDSIDIVAYDTLTPLEQRLMTNHVNRNIVEQARRYFYLASTEELCDIISQTMSMDAKVDRIEIYPDKKIDKVVMKMM